MDFKALLADLQRAGLTQTQIAEACACRQSTVSDLARGATDQPRFSVGNALIKLHKRHCARLPAAKPQKQAA